MGSGYVQGEQYKVSNDSLRRVRFLTFGRRRRTGGLQSTVINSGNVISVLSKDIAGEIKCVNPGCRDFGTHVAFHSSLQQTLAEAENAFRNRSQEHDAKRQALQGVEARYREAEVRISVT